MRDYRKIYIDGEWIQPSGGQVVNVINPATEQPAGQITLADRKNKSPFGATPLAGTPQGIVKLMDHALTVPQYIVIMTSSEHSLSYSSHSVMA
jgi:hypothetical protein